MVELRNNYCPSTLANSRYKEPPLEQGEDSQSNGREHAGDSDLLNTVLRLGGLARRRLGARTGVGGGASGSSAAGTGGRVASASSLAGHREGCGGRQTLADVFVTVEVTLGVGAIERVAVDLTRGVNNNTTLDVFDVGELGLGEVTDKVNGTANERKVAEANNSLEVSVVGNLETTANAAQLRSRGVGQLGVGNDGKGLTDLSKLRKVDAINGVVDEAHRQVDLLQRRQVDGRAELECSIVGPLEVRERDIDLGCVEGDVEKVGDGGNTNSDVGDETVVVDVKVIDLAQVQTVERIQLGVGDKNVTGLLDTFVELHFTQSRQSAERDAANLGEGRHGQSAKRLQNGQLKVITNASELRSRDRCQVSQVDGRQRAIKLLDTVENEVCTSGLNGNITVELLAASHFVEVSLASDVERSVANIGLRAVAGSTKRCGGKRAENQRPCLHF